MSKQMKSMASKSYQEQSENLLKAIDIAIEVVRANPINGFNEQHLQLFVDSYQTWKNQLLHAEPKFQTLTSLKYNVADVFTYFNEGTGETVDEFWKKIKNEGLPYERENKLEKIILKKKIKNQQEYDYVTDTMVPFKQEGLINEEQFALLNRLVGDFENKLAKKR